MESVIAYVKLQLCCLNGCESVEVSHPFGGGPGMPIEKNAAIHMIGDLEALMAFWCTSDAYFPL